MHEVKAASMTYPKVEAYKGANTALVRVTNACEISKYAGKERETQWQTKNISIFSSKG